VNQPPADKPLHLIRGIDGPLLYDTNRVRTYPCNAAEAYVLGAEGSGTGAGVSDSSFAEGELAQARDRIDRLSGLSRSLAETVGVSDPYRGSPTYLLLHVCDACNLRCAYCYAEGCRDEGGRGRMTAETARRSVDFLLDHCRPEEGCVITFAGGEPLLNIEAVEAAATHARRRQRERAGDLDLRILTNGTVMSPRILRLVSQQSIFLQISLDGPPEVHDRLRLTRRGDASSRKVLETIELLETAGVRRFRVRATLSRHNSDVDRIESFYRANGIRDFSIQPVMCGRSEPFRLEAADLKSVSAYYRDLSARPGGTQTESASDRLPGDILALLAKLAAGVKTKRHCGAGRGMLVVSPEGHFYPCPALVGDPLYRIGDLENGATADPELGLQNLSVDEKPTCRSCWARNLCGGGCAAQAIRINGAIAIPDPQECELTKARIEAAVVIHHRLSA